MVTCFDVCEILEMLSEASVKVFLDGGWGGGFGLDIARIDGLPVNQKSLIILKLSEIPSDFQNNFQFLRKMSPTPLVFRRALHRKFFRKYDSSSPDPKELLQFLLIGLS